MNQFGIQLLGNSFIKYQAPSNYFATFIPHKVYIEPSSTTRLNIWTSKCQRKKAQLSIKKPLAFVHHAFQSDRAAQLITRRRQSTTFRFDWVNAKENKDEEEEEKRFLRNEPIDTTLLASARCQIIQITLHFSSPSSARRVCAKAKNKKKKRVKKSFSSQTHLRSIKIAQDKPIRTINQSAFAFRSHPVRSRLCVVPSSFLLSSERASFFPFAIPTIR